MPFRHRNVTSRRARSSRALACAILPVLACSVARAGTGTGTMSVTMTITAGCTVATGSTIPFGTASVLSAATAAQGTLGITCTNTTPYNVGLDAGSGSGATVATRKMTGPSNATINYTLWQNSALTTAFGNTVGTNTETGTGTGALQSVTVYGQVPSQTSPAPGAYSDVVNVTVTF